MPFLNRLLDYGETITVIAILIVYNLYMFADYLFCTTLFLMFNNATSSNNRGKLNGLSMSVASVARIFSPPITSIVFAWSVNQNGYIINHHFMFVILAIMMGIAACIYKCFPGQLEQTPEFELTVLDESMTLDRDDELEDEEMDLKILTK